MKKIFIIEDEPAVLIGLEAALEDENYEILTASDGLIGYHEVKKKKPDLLILDLMLPSKNGYEICKDLRQDGFTLPILMLTSKTEESDKLNGFAMGADDYVTKPFSILELQARIKALLKRTAGIEKKEAPKDIDSYEFGELFFDFKKLECAKNNYPVNLSAKEFQIIKYFIQRKGEVITRDQLLDDVWGYDNYPSTRTVDNYILNIRKVLEPDPANPKYFLTIHTVGYKLNI